MNTKKLLLTAACVAWLTTSAVFGISVTGFNSDGEPLAATADFAFTATTLTITLTNDLTAAQVRSAGQSLSDFEFTLSGGSSITALTNISGTAVDLHGTPSSGATVTPGTPVTLDEWSLQPASGTGSFNLTALNGGMPDYMIVGGALGTTFYPNGNNGIGNFNSYLQHSGTFTISGTFAPGATLSNISFSFGTGPETIIGAPDSGATVALLGLAMIGLAAFRAKFRKT